MMMLGVTYTGLGLGLGLGASSNRASSNRASCGVHQVLSSKDVAIGNWIPLSHTVVIAAQLF